MRDRIVDQRRLVHSSSKSFAELLRRPRHRSVTLATKKQLGEEGYLSRCQLALVKEVEELHERASLANSVHNGEYVNQRFLER